ncbi:diguanylate cyclase domain-containing protein [Mycobacterium sp. smrl_JER01]|uniref:diguanylate cyclase domain-containing protein n=1 Tax=Mycobacterium sp. smrl_JER01 TaxID=3402633 RepID=UPI003ACAC4E2
MTYFLVFPLFYALAVFAGRATRLGGGEVSMVWPAAAVGVIWLLAVRDRGPRERALHLALLAVVAYTSNIATGAAPPLAGWFVLVNVVLSVVTVELLAYRRDQVVLRDPADLARLVAAVTVATTGAAVLATAYFVVVNGSPVWDTFALFAVRNGTSVLVGVSIWLRMRDATWTPPRMSAATVIEVLLVGAGLVAVFFWAFWASTGLPMAYVVLVPAMWVALRYSTTASTLFLTGAGTWIVFATLMGRGPLIVPDVQARALLSQAMVGSLGLVVLTLSLYRDSRVRLIAELESARDRADQNAELLGAVLDNIHDGVILVGSSDEVVLQNARAAASGLVDEVVSAASGHTDARSGEAAGLAGLRDIVIEAEDAHVVELTTAPLPQTSPLTVMAFRDVTEERANARALRDARDLFAGVLRAASEQAIIGTDPTGRITLFNHGAERLLGWTEAEMLGRTPVDLHDYPELCARAAALGIPAGFPVLVHNVTPESAEVGEWTYRRRDGTRAAVSLAVSRMAADDGTCAGYICVATDITERKEAEHALSESEERFRLAFDTAPMGMFLFGVGAPGFGRITRCNQAMADLLGRSTGEVLDMTVADLSPQGTHPGTVGLDQILRLRPAERFEAETPFLRADGVRVWGAVSASVIAPQGSEPYGICLVEDITTRKRVEAELQYLASHDPLTGLANRALFTDRIEHALARAANGQSDGVGVIFLDLDGFKAVNDTWGHAEGDAVLTVVTRRIESAIRPTDTVARLGGDEFAVLCPGVSDPDRLQHLAERIRAEVRRPVLLTGGGSYDHLSVSAGVVTSGPGCTAETLLRRADRLMYRAKRNGKDCVTMGDPENVSDTPELLGGGVAPLA